MWQLSLFRHCGRIHTHAATDTTLRTLSYVPASLCPKDRPSCGDTITLLFSEWGRKDSSVLASQSRLCGSGSLQQRSAEKQDRAALLISIFNANRLFRADWNIRFSSNLHSKYASNINNKMFFVKSYIPKNIFIWDNFVLSIANNITTFHVSFQLYKHISIIYCLLKLHKIHSHIPLCAIQINH